MKDDVIAPVVEPARERVGSAARERVASEEIGRKMSSEIEDFLEKKKETYNPEWNPTGIEGGVDTNSLPWIAFPDAPGCFYKPLRASRESGQFSIVGKINKGVVQPDLIYLGAADYMVISGKMTYPDGPMQGQLEAGVWAYVPAEEKMAGLKADEDVEYVMNCYGPIAFLDKDGKSTKSLFTVSDIHKACAERGLNLVPSSLAEMMQEAPPKYTGEKAPLAISDPQVCALLQQADGIAKSDKKQHPHYVDTKSLEWFESMPGVGLKVLRVSEETGTVTVMVKHNAAAPPHYHLGPADFFMLSGRLGYRAGPPEGYGPGMWFYEPAGARHESTESVTETEDTVYLANIYGPIQFDSGLGTPVLMVFSWMSYLGMAEANGFTLVNNVFPNDNTHLATTTQKTVDPEVEKNKAEQPSVYNPEWNPTGIEGGVNANKLPWIPFPSAPGCFYKPLRASREAGRFSIVGKITKGTVQPDVLHLGAADFMVLSGKMTFPTGPLEGTVDEGCWGYVPADAMISGLTADEDVEYVMNCYGAMAFLEKDLKSVKTMITCKSVQAAAAERGITLVPSTLNELMADRPEAYAGPDEPLAISDDKVAKHAARKVDAKKMSAHCVDTKALEWFESMPGVGLKILRVSEETGSITVMVRHNAAAPPHYHLGCADFFMLQGRLGYRAGPPEGYGPGMWFFEPAGARHESTEPVTESEDTVYLANIHGPIQFDSGVGTPIAMVFSWMSYLAMAEGNGFNLVKNVFPDKESTRLAVL